MTIARLVGIDPGVVDTGVVVIELQIEGSFNSKTSPPTTRVSATGDTVSGLDPDAIEAKVRSLNEWLTECIRSKPREPQKIFVEGYRQRSVFEHDAEMLTAVKAICKQLNADAVSNSGIKKIISPHVLGMLDLQSHWPKSNHGDILSAVRIALLGAAKDPELNKLLFEILRSRHYDNGIHFNYRF